MSKSFGKSNCRGPIRVFSVQAQRSVLYPLDLGALSILLTSIALCMETICNEGPTFCSPVAMKFTVGY